MRGKSVAAAAVALLTTTGHVLTADLPTSSPSAPLPAAIYNWTGIYVGVNGGWGDGNSNWTDGTAGETGRFPISGYLIGGTVGGNYQTGPYVFGIERDFDWTNLRGGSGSTCGAIF